MQINKCVLSLFILCLPIVLLAQTDEDAAKIKQARLNAIVEQSLNDVQNLRLPENRALFYCQIGNLVWPQDQKRGHFLFQGAATELINAQAFAESRRKINPYNELLTGGNARSQILNIIAQRDAEFALELLVKTRPAAIQRAMASTSDKTAGMAANNGKIGGNYQNDGYLAQNETYLEQSLYRLAAEQNPDRAVKLLKESLAKGISNDTLNQLTRLAEKDQAAAADMAIRVVDKLLHSNYVSEGQPQYQNIQVSMSIVNSFVSTPENAQTRVKFDDSQMRELAAKLISAYIDDKRAAPYIGQGIVTIAEKLLPSSVEQIKKVTGTMYPQNSSSEFDTAYRNLMAENSPPEQMLAAAGKFPVDIRRQILQTASSRLMSQGNAAAARAVLAENFSDDARDEALRNFDTQYAYNLIGQGKFTEAESVIDGLPDQQRISALVNLANSAYSRDQKENKPYALAILDRATQLTGERPENSQEMSMLMQVIGGYGNIEPSEAIRIFEGVVPKINELTDAAAVLNGFQNNSNVRDGEFIMTQGDPFNQYGANLSMIGAFSRADFDRTMRLIDSFSRQEMRISLRLRLVETGIGQISDLPIQGRSFSTMMVFSSRID